MQFEKYVHLERFGTDAVDGINLGDCYIFPKIDGTNASVWMNDNGTLGCGSRNRTLSLDDDNAGFMNWAVEQKILRMFFADHPHLRLFGEWLVPHSLKTYRKDAWRKFYVFDVMDATGTFWHYDGYLPLMKQYGIDFIPCVLKARNPTYEVLSHETQKNKFLIEENNGFGEGIVIKNYGWENRFGVTTWAKLITNTFKDKHIVEMGGSVVDTKMVEQEIAEEFVTGHLVEKIIAKIRNDQGAFGARQIPQLLGMAFHDLVTEELWEALKKHKNPKVDFRTLNTFAIGRVKALKPELFGVRA